MEKFKKIYVEITNICNLSCDFCPKTKRQLQFMTEEDFRHILQEVKPYTSYLYFHLMGEPLLNPRLETFLEEAGKEGFKVNLTTNGTLLKKHQEILMNASALRQVNISLHSYETNKSELSFESYIDEVVQFVKSATSKNIICSIRLWNMDTASLQGANTLNGRILEMLQEKLEVETVLSEALQEKNSLKLGPKLYINMAEKFEWPDKDREIISEQVFCYGLKDHIGILVDGTVVPCCLDSEANIPLGNVHTESLKEILASDRAKAMQKGFQNRCAVEALCKRCGYAQKFN
ncbi:MAG: radical SAM/SPASM domain-containing protein [Cellulosilyticaceae bacterium]